MYELFDLTDPACPTCRGVFPTRRLAHRAALEMNLRAYQVCAVPVPCPT
jgi:hypothetical protein